MDKLLSNAISHISLSNTEKSWSDVEWESIKNS